MLFFFILIFLYWVHKQIAYLLLPKSSLIISLFYFLKNKRDRSLKKYTIKIFILQVWFIQICLVTIINLLFLNYNQW